MRWGIAVAFLLVGVAACGSEATTTTETTIGAATSTVPATSTTLAPGVLAVLGVDHHPSGILVVDGVIWTEDHAQSRRAYAVDPETGASLVAIAVTRPCDVVATEGRVWVADLQTGRLVWIDTTTQEVGGEVAGLSGPCGLQVADDAVWFVVDEGLGRLDLETEQVTITDLRGGAFPGSGTPLWAADFAGGDLYRVNTASGDVELTIPHPAGPTEGPPVAAGFGSLWVGGPADVLYRLDPVTGEVLAEIAATKATRLLVTSGGVWLTSFERGVVERVDPATDEVVLRIRLGGSPNGIAEGLGSIWVSDTSRGRIFRIDPAAEGLAE